MNDYEPNRTCENCGASSPRVPICGECQAAERAFDAGFEAMRKAVLALLAEASKGEWLFAGTALDHLHYRVESLKLCDKEPVTKMTLPPIVGAVYRHHKGDLYTVEGFALHHDTRAVMVLYRSHAKNLVNARPLEGTELDPDGWNVPVDGKPRFELHSEPPDARDKHPW